MYVYDHDHVEDCAVQGKDLGPTLLVEVCGFGHLYSLDMGDADILRYGRLSELSATNYNLGRSLFLLRNFRDMNHTPRKAKVSSLCYEGPNSPTAIYPNRAIRGPQQGQTA